MERAASPKCRRRPYEEAKRQGNPDAGNPAFPFYLLLTEALDMRPKTTTT